MTLWQIYRNIAKPMLEDGVHAHVCVRPQLYSKFIVHMFTCNTCLYAYLHTFTMVCTCSYLHITWRVCAYAIMCVRSICSGLYVYATWYD